MRTIRFLSITLIYIFVSCIVHINPISKISVSSGGSTINKGGTYDFGNIYLSEESGNIDFSVTNIGKKKLILSGNPIILISGTNASEFKLDFTNLKTEISSNKSSSFFINFIPSSSGLKNARITIQCNDYSNEFYTFDIIGTCIKPVIIVKYESMEITTGTSTIDFGDIHINDYSDEFEFQIYNIGTGDLTLTNTQNLIEISGTNANDFDIDITSTQQKITQGNYTVFKIKFHPTTLGLNNATISIENSDKYKNPFVFHISGTGTEEIIEIKTSSDEDIENGTGKFDFGNKLLNYSRVATFKIYNTGTANLNLTGSPIVKISGSGASVFSVTEEPLSPIEKSTYSEFEISFTPTVEQNYTATVEIINSDIDENPYTFTIEGEGIVKTANSDFNGDGIADIIIGADNNLVNGKYSGSAYIFFGNTNYSSSLNASSADVKLNGENDDDRFGCSVAFVGDVNKDGLADVIVGAYGVDYAGSYSGKAYIFFGNSNPSPTINATQADVILYGTSSSMYFGINVSSAGDFNDDGYKDVIVGSRYGNNQGAAYVFYGASQPTSHILATNADLIIYGEKSQDYFADSTASAGDINNDNIDDIIIGAAGYDDISSDEGCAYIFYGSQNPASTINAQNADVKIVGINDNGYLGTSVSSAGDFNNDGIDDVIVGAWRNTSKGNAYIIFGKSNLSSKISASNAEVMLTGNTNWGDCFGRVVSYAGDINNDGIDDVLVADTECDFNYSIYGSGCVYIFLGSSNPSSNLGYSDAFCIIYGSSRDDHIGESISSGGDFNNDGICDIVFGAPDDDDGGNRSGCAFILYGKTSYSSPIISSNVDIKVVGENIGAHLGSGVSGG